MSHFDESRARKEAIAKAWHKTWNDYCNVSCVHGMKYIIDKNVSIYIRFGWAIIVLVLFALANRMAYALYVDFIEDPIRMIIESDHANTAKLLYPAVTVCPATLFNHSKAKDFLQTLDLPENVTGDDVLGDLDQSYGFIMERFKYSRRKLDALQAAFKPNNYTAVKFFQSNHWDCRDFFDRCRFQSKAVDCSEVFRVMKTFAGFCCSFNDHSTELPPRQFKSNRHAMREGLSFILKDVELDLEHTYSNSQRFKVLVHEAHVYPDKYTFQKNLYKNEELLLRADPTETICSREVWKRLTVAERKCALASEIKLKFFLQYRQQNCFTECTSFLAKKLCGCVPFYMFRDNETLVCDFEHIPCLSENYDRMVSMRKKCQCVDTCEKVDFSVRLTRASLKNTVDTPDPFYDDISSNFTVIHVYMQSQLYRRVRRDITWNIVSIGGNLGNCYSLFVGMSVLSVLQLLYFFTFVLRRNYSHILRASLERERRIFWRKEKMSER